MREQDAKRPPGAVTDGRAESERHEDTGSREHRTKEAARKDRRGAEEALRPGPSPPPGIEEDYGARSGDVPSEEPGKPRR